MTFRFRHFDNDDCIMVGVAQVVDLGKDDDLSPLGVDIDILELWDAEGKEVDWNTTPKFRRDIKASAFADYDTTVSIYLSDEPDYKTQF